MTISAPKFRGRPPENTVKQGVSDTPPPKFRGEIAPPKFRGYGLTGFVQTARGVQKVCAKQACARFRPLVRAGDRPGGGVRSEVGGWVVSYCCDLVGLLQNRFQASGPKWKKINATK